MAPIQEGSVWRGEPYNHSIKHKELRNGLPRQDYIAEPVKRHGLCASGGSGPCRRWD
jgi:hypothetical protein